jgi:hypothetical protein
MLRLSISFYSLRARIRRCLISIRLKLLLTQSQANTLAFALYELAKHPGFQERLRFEIHSTMGRSSGPEVPYDGHAIRIRIPTTLMPANSRGEIGASVCYAPLGLNHAYAQCTDLCQRWPDLMYDLD